MQKQSSELRTTIAMLCLAVSVSFASAAAPASGPSTQPVDAQHVLIERSASHYSIILPKSWKVAQRNDQLAVFRMSADASFVLANMPDNNTGNSATDLAGAVKGLKESLLEKYPTLKVDKDEATQADGTPAWELSCLLPTKATNNLTMRSILCWTTRGLTGITVFYPQQDAASYESETNAALATFRWAAQR